MTAARTVRLDPHVHTDASPDAEGTVHEVLAYAHNREVDAVAITDHDTTVGARRALEVQKRYDETVAWIRARGGLAVAPHPFQVSRHGVRKADIGDCDGVEVFNAWAMTGLQNRRADAFAARRGHPKLGGSDAHDPATVGNAYTEVDVGTASSTAGEILEAVAAGRTRAVGRRLRSTPGSP